MLSPHFSEIRLCLSQPAVFSSYHSCKLQCVNRLAEVRYISYKWIFSTEHQKQLLIFQNYDLGRGEIKKLKNWRKTRHVLLHPSSIQIQQWTRGSIFWLSWSFEFSRRKNRKTKRRTREEEKKRFFFVVFLIRLLPAIITGCREEWKCGHALKLWSVCVCGVCLFILKKKKKKDRGRLTKKRQNEERTE